MTVNDCWRPTCNPSWETLDEPEAPLVWSCEGDGIVQGTLELDAFARRTLVLQIAPGQVALLARHGDLRAVLLEGQHALAVGEREEDLGSDARLVFLATDRSWRVSWGDGPDAAYTGGAPPRSRGMAALRITNPALFYASFLRHAEEVGEPFLRRLVGALCESRLTDGAVADGEAGALDLRAYGLACEALAAADRVLRDPSAREHVTGAHAADDLAEATTQDMRAESASPLAI